MWIVRVFSSIAFLISIVLSIPLAFDVGGRTCGLAFSFSLATFYFFYSTLKLLTPESSRFRWTFAKVLGLVQWIVLPSLLIWSLNRFSVDSEFAGDGWFERTFGGKRAKDTSVYEWILGHDGLVELATLGCWEKILQWSTPVFQLCEGFCSLLVVQAAGQITRWAVNRSSRNDTWMIIFLVMSASIISSSVYFLWRITTFPEIGNVDAILIGMAITSTVILGGWGIGSGRGNPVESSLLFAYTTLCIYQIFTDYQPSHPSEALPPAQAADFPPLPPIIMASYTTIVQALSTLPTMVHAAFHFVIAAFSTITPSIFISLAYRLFVFYASTRIIPAVRESGARALSQEPSLEDTDGAGQILGFLSWFSPSILIAVYTSLLMQHFASTADEDSLDAWSQHGDAGSNLWKWVNLSGTLALYALELYLGKDEMDESLTGHWKTD
ncbi:MAG: hypothetical protein LQ340_001323 [Diploschistes diacapsis]|nr:MAG: hypothetical protein LQ340_001323 [Diploschistes diacapsis]